MRAALAMATEVQQGLLPQEPPKVPGLDVAAHSHYCDETGGDYFDFLPTPHRPPSTLTVACGDVTGHGVAAALLMAGVRAILNFAPVLLPERNQVRLKNVDLRTYLEEASFLLAPSRVLSPLKSVVADSMLLANRSPPTHSAPSKTAATMPASNAAFKATRGLTNHTVAIRTCVNIARIPPRELDNTSAIHIGNRSAT